MLENETVGVIGAGKIGQAILGGLLKKGVVQEDRVVASAINAKAVQEVKVQFPNVFATEDNLEVVRRSSIIILAVKPNVMAKVLRQIGSHISSHQLVLSVATGYSTQKIEDLITHPAPVVRAMPNTPVVIGMGMTALCPGKHADDMHKQMAEAVFRAVGEVVWLPEDMMSAATAISGAGPAYFYMLLEAFAEASVRVGVNRDTANLMVAQTMLGSAAMALQSSRHPAQLKADVTTPAGVTIEGLITLEEGNIRATCARAIWNATRRGDEIFEES